MATVVAPQTQKKVMTETPLSHRLRNETKEAHTAAERSGIMRDLLRGKIEKPAYVALLQNLAALYEALESELDKHASNPALSGVDWKVLRRFPSLQHDISALGDGSHPSALVPATRAYVERLHALGSSAPQLLFAHAYLRYLGDLYGGQIIKRIVTETFGSESAAAISFYEFENINNLDAFKSTFRSAIDNIAPTAANHDDMVAEALRGYEWHAQIFQQLAD